MESLHFQFNIELGHQIFILLTALVAKQIGAIKNNIKPSYNNAVNTKSKEHCSSTCSVLSNSMYKQEKNNSKKIG